MLPVMPVVHDLISVYKYLKFFDDGSLYDFSGRIQKSVAGSILLVKIFVPFTYG